jgi:hypothetical protein
MLSSFEQQDFMLRFLNDLFSNGELVVQLVEPPVDPSEILDVVKKLERMWRCELPRDPPVFMPEVAVAATQILMAVSRAVVHREISMEETEHVIQRVCLTEDNTASQHYSMDLVLRFLPQVADRARRISEADTLLDLLGRIGQQWPLSSVGMRGCHPERLPMALQHPTLWRMYIDRIISTKDVARINIPSVRDAVAASLGPFPHLAPTFSTTTLPVSTP